MDKKVRLGIDRIAVDAALFKDKKVGLVTNQTGLTSDLISSIFVFSERTKLMCLFGPEHGVRGALPGGLKVGHYTDPVTQLPVFSLYGDIKAPTTEMLYPIDVLVFDMQDVGVRFYTYITTLYECLKAAASNDKELVVLDRPNPLGGIVVEGPILEAKHQSFVGVPGLPIRYGLTIGELAGYFNKEFKINCKLHVVPLEGWTRAMVWEDTRLYWQSPSPNLPTCAAASVYPGNCLFEGTNISEGRGTTKPFEYIGAPWIDGDKLASQLNGGGLAGVKFLPAHFVPMGVFYDAGKGQSASNAQLVPGGFNPHYQKYQGEMCHGVQFCVLDVEKFRPVECAVRLLSVIRNDYKELYNLRIADGQPWINYLVGTSALSEPDWDPNALLAQWNVQCAEFKEKSRAYHVY